jgi:hypothetical protein
MEQFQVLIQSLSSGDLHAIFAALLGMGAIFLILLALFSLIMVSITIIILVYLYVVLKKIPQQFRKMEPGMVFLLLIPCFSTIWLFFVNLRISDSFKAYFDSKNDTSVGDCGKQLGLWAAILNAAGVVFSWIPLFGQLFPLAGLVLFILFLVKINTLKSQIKD